MKAPCHCEPCGQYRRLQCATKCATRCRLQVWRPPPLVTGEVLSITWEVFRGWHPRTLPKTAPQNVSFESRSTYHETQTFRFVWSTSTANLAGTQLSRHARQRGMPPLFLFFFSSWVVKPQLISSDPRACPRLLPAYRRAACAHSVTISLIQDLSTCPKENSTQPQVRKCTLFANRF